jgi:threonyl-tRNA synthetase
VRVQLDERSEKMQAKIRDAQLQKIPYMVVIGGREEQAGTLAIRHRQEGDLGPMTLEEFAERVKKETADRMAASP